MSIFTSLGILILAMLIQGFLQTSPSIFAIFYHYTSGKTSAKKADDQSLSFILGVEIATAVMFLATYFIITFLAAERIILSSVFLWIMSGIFIILGIITFFFYFRPGKKNRQATTLFVSRLMAKNFIYHISHNKNRTDTIILGFLSSITEVIFTLPLFIISSIEIISLSPRFNFIFIIAYIVAATIPLFAIRISFRTGHNLAEIQRLRIKRKMFFRFIISAGYVGLAILTFLSGVVK
jgi:hypothetical protein